jgi:hypothetical protein
VAVLVCWVLAWGQRWLHAVGGRSISVGRPQLVWALCGHGQYDRMTSYVPLHVFKCFGFMGAMVLVVASMMFDII